MKNKLFKLKRYLLLPQAAKYLSTLFDEEVTEDDILQLAVDQHLVLSVNLVGNTPAYPGKIVSSDEVRYHDKLVTTKSERMDAVVFPKEYAEMKKAGRKTMRIMSSRQIDSNRYINFEWDDITHIEGVHDLPMIGCEKDFILRKSRMLIESPDINERNETHGAYVLGENGSIYSLQESYNKDDYGIDIDKPIEVVKERIKKLAAGLVIQDEKKILRKEKQLLESYYKQREKRLEYLERRKQGAPPSWGYYPYGEVPDDIVLVVRTQALLDLQERLFKKGSASNSSLDKRAETSYLNVIGALLEIVTGTFKDETFSSETKLREFIAEKFDDLRGVRPRTTAQIFAAAKRSLNDDLD